MRQAEIAAYLCMSTRNFRELLAQGILPKKATIDEYRRTYIEHLRMRASGRLATGPVDPATEKALLDRSRREEIEMRLAEKRAELIPADAVRDLWVGALTITRTKILNVPSRESHAIADMTNPRDIERALLTAIREALRDGVDEVSKIYGVNLDERQAGRNNGQGAQGVAADDGGGSPSRAARGAPGACSPQ